ncbi:MAG: helix-turn-helix transcriptional regulator [Gemmatimonadaceae bacterium]|nr:helix-turn-helix transcriptional regulator [Gemmatimonadaceae bacterium]
MLSHHLIREARRRAGITQAELAERASTTQSAVARWESGRSLPSLEKLSELVECCGLEVAVSLTPVRDSDDQLLADRSADTYLARLEHLLAALPYEGGDLASDATGASDVPEHFAPLELLSALERHRVRYVLVGGLAAVLHGAPMLTTDVDIAPEGGSDNLRRLALALSEVGAVARGHHDPRAWTPDLSASGLARAALHRFETRHGGLDLLFQPTGTAGYDDLRQKALSVALGDVTVTVASLSDVIRSKEAAGRGDDRVTVPMLRRLQRLAARQRRSNA